MIKSDILLVQKGKYPFCMSKSIQNQKKLILVQEDLYYENDIQYNILKEKIILRKTLSHPYLISISHVSQEKGCFKIFYEYVHLQMNGKWGKLLGNDFFKKVQQQMLHLVDYLRSKNLRFMFDPKNLGISQQMNAKYFLQNFDIEQTDDGLFFETIKQSIVLYFDNFKEKSPNKPKTRTDLRSSEKLGQARTTNQLQSLVQQTKKKSEQLLQRIKRS